MILLTCRALQTALQSSSRLKSSRQRNVNGAMLVAMLLLAAAGCAKPPGLEALGAGVAEVRLAIDDVRAEHVLAAYYDATEKRHGLRGSARVALSGPDFKLNRPQNITLERPANLRFEIVGLFDQLAAVLATNGNEYAFYEAGQPQIERGRLAPGLLWNLARIDLEPQELVGLLLGAPLPSSGVARAAVWLEGVEGAKEAEGAEASQIAIAFAWPEEGRVIRAPGMSCAADSALSGADPDCFLSLEAMATGGEIFVFDEEGRLVEMRALDEGGRLRYRAGYADYEPLAMGTAGSEGATTLFPHQVTIESPEADSVARFQWKRVMLADELSDQYFRLPEHGGRPAGG